MQTHTQSSNALSDVAVRRANSRPARGFTLVELLVVISIIAILAGMVLGALYTSQEAARGRRTEALIRKLHDQMAIRWESYQTRRLPIDPLVQTTAAGAFTDSTPGAFPKSIEDNFVNSASPTDVELIAARTLLARRELMRMELPDHYSDLDPSFNPTFLRVTDVSSPPSTVGVFPSAWKSYLKRIERVIGFAPTSMADYSTIQESNQSAECLYLILTSGMGSDGGAIFSERDTGDTDEDGMLEFIDAWGNPIEWIRWPAGFVSDMQPAEIDTSGANPTVTRSVLSNPNAFDTQRIDPNPVNFIALQPRGYGIFPLIASSGPDGEFGLAFRWNTEAASTRYDPYALHDPEAGATDDSPRQRGETLQFRRETSTPFNLLFNNLSGDSGYNGYEQDNVHNHLLNQ